MRPIAYLVDNFPGVETFILSEMESLKRYEKIVLFSWDKKEAAVTHDLAKKWLPNLVIAGNPLSPKVIFANAYLLFNSPVKYIKAFLCNKNYAHFRRFLRACYFAWVAKKMGIRHIHAHFSWSANGALLISELAGIPYSCTMHHGDILYFPPENMPLVINKSKFTAMISNFNSEYILKRWPEVDADKLKLIRVGINFNNFIYPKVRQRRQRVRLLTVARLHPIKQIPFHLEICKELGDKIEWRFIGDGMERKKIEKLIKEYNLEDRVNLLGMVAYEDMVKEYQEADIFVLLSKSEGIPTVLIEAMATCLPVVATNITGIPELVENEVNGYLISNSNLDGAAEAIIKLIESPELREKMGRHGRQKVLEEYTQEQNSKKMRDLLKLDLKPY